MYIEADAELVRIFTSVVERQFHLRIDVEMLMGSYASVLITDHLRLCAETAAFCISVEFKPQAFYRGRFCPMFGIFQFIGRICIGIMSFSFLFVGICRVMHSVGRYRDNAPEDEHEQTKQHNGSYEDSAENFHPCSLFYGFQRFYIPFGDIYIHFFCHIFVHLPAFFAVSQMLFYFLTAVGRSQSVAVDGQKILNN